MDVPEETPRAPYTIAHRYDGPICNKGQLLTIIDNEKFIDQAIFLAIARRNRGNDVTVTRQLS